MNDYIIYINGMLVGPSLFEARGGNSPNIGRHLQIIAHEDKVRDACDGVKKLKSIDVLEVRASNIVKRYRYEKSGDEKDENFTRLPPNEEDKLPARVRFRCVGVSSSF